MFFDRLWKREAPTGVKIIAAFFYFGVLLSFILFVLSIFGKSPGSYFIPPVFLAIAAFINMIFDFFVAKGLLFGKNWVRIILIILFATSLLSGIFAPVRYFGEGLYLVFVVSLINLIISASIFFYLTFNKKVKAYFSR